MQFASEWSQKNILLNNFFKDWALRGGIIKITSSLNVLSINFWPKLNSNQLSFNEENDGTYEKGDREIFSLPINNSFNFRRSFLEELN